jgi:hypothetical protein
MMPDGAEAFFPKGGWISRFARQPRAYGGHIEDVPKENLIVLYGLFLG